LLAWQSARSADLRLAHRVKQLKCKKSCQRQRLDRLEIHLKQEREERTGDLICNRYMQIKVCADVKSAQEKIKQRITQPNPIELDVRVRELKNHTRVLAALHILHVCRECTSARRTLGSCIEKSFLYFVLTALVIIQSRECFMVTTPECNPML
jgi:hypothetical protein